MSHYFVNDVSVATKIHNFTYAFQDRVYSFACDNGLFSKEHVDYASSLLVETIGLQKGSLLDLGCGCGCMGIMLAGAYDLELTMTDINEKAVEYAAKNAKQNQVAAECFVSDCFSGIDRRFDTIVLNPPIHAGKSVLFQMYEDSILHLNPYGRFFIILQKKHGAESTFKKLKEIYQDVSILYKKKGFYIFQCVLQSA